MKEQVLGSGLSGLWLLVAGLSPLGFQVSGVRDGLRILKGMAHRIEKNKDDVGLDVFNAMRFALCFMLLVLSQ